VELTLTEFVSLDGVSQGPGAPDEHLSDGSTRGGWLVPHLEDEIVQPAVTWIGEADAFLWQAGRELQIHDSARLAQSLLAAGLIDPRNGCFPPVGHRASGYCRARGRATRRAADRRSPRKIGKPEALPRGGKGPLTCTYAVGDTGIEPVTSPV
jgi:hypothetical protein